MEDIYPPVMKQEADIFRAWAIQGIMKRIKAKGIEVIVYKPVLKKEKFYSFRIVNDFEAFNAETRNDFLESYGTGASGGC